MIKEAGERGEEGLAVRLGRGALGVRGRAEYILWQSLEGLPLGHMDGYGPGWCVQGG